MYEVQEIQDYKQKWLEAERDLAINWAEPPFDLESIDSVDKDTERANKRNLGGLSTRHH